MPRFRASQLDDPWVVEMSDYASVPVENSVALFAYLACLVDIEVDPPHIKKMPVPAVSADVLLRAFQAINRYAVAQEIRNEDAVAVLVAQMKSICAKYMPIIIEESRQRAFNVEEQARAHDRWVHGGIPSRSYLRCVSMSYGTVMKTAGVNAIDHFLRSTT